MKKRIMRALPLAAVAVPLRSGARGAAVALGVAIVMATATIRPADRSRDRAILSGSGDAFTA
jgi:hypothetical protein